MLLALYLILCAVVARYMFALCSKHERCTEYAKRRDNERQELAERYRCAMTDSERQELEQANWK